jgi:uncharacterized coiled-coil protein SlyX
MSFLVKAPRIAVLLAGVAAGALSRLLESRGRSRAALLERTVQDLENRMTARDAAQDNRLAALETRLNEHEAKLHNVPSTDQIVSAMEELLAKATASLDERLMAQAQSIEVLKSTVTQSDELLERVLESLDLLRQGFEDPGSGDQPLSRAPQSK